MSTRVDCAGGWTWCDGGGNK